MISVVLPVRDGERYLEEAVCSVLGQTYTDVEVIIVDDGSVDRTAEIIADLAGRDDRITTLRLGGVGVSAALNAGIARATRPWIARMDADDVSLPRRLERQLEVARAQPQVGAWATWARAVDDAGRTLSLIPNGPTSLDEFGAQHRAGQLRPIHSTMLIDRSLLLEAGGYDPSVRRAQDIELWDRFGQLSPILTLPEPLVHVRVHERSATTQMFAETARTHRFVIARRRAAERGERLSFDDFIEAERTAPLPQRAVRRLEVRGLHLHRRAGVRLAQRRYAAGVINEVLAALLAPHIVVPRAWRQFVAPRITRTGRGGPRGG